MFLLLNLLVLIILSLFCLVVVPPYATACSCFSDFMGNRDWNVLCWNVRGINDSDKWDAIRYKIEESNAGIFCLQETKKESFDIRFIRKFAPKRFDKFDFYPSLGASGGILVCWASSIFSINTLEKQ